MLTGPWQISIQLFSYNVSDTALSVCSQLQCLSVSLSNHVVWHSAAVLELELQRLPSLRYECFCFAFTGHCFALADLVLLMDSVLSKKVSKLFDLTILCAGIISTHRFICENV